MPFKHLFLTIIASLTLPLTAIAQAEHTLFNHGSSVQTVAYSPVNPFLIASSGNNGAIKLWNLRNDTVVTLGRHGDTLNSIAFSPDRKLLATGDNSGQVNVWDLQSHRAVTHGNQRIRSENLHV